MQDLIYLAYIWSAVYVSHLLARVTKLTAVLWFLASGCLLVNLGVLPHEPSEFLRVFSEVGIIIIMFALGFEENSDHFIKSIKRSWGIALFGALVPFAVTYFLVQYFGHDKQAALICGLAMTATAVSLTMVSLKSEGLLKSPAATGIMTSAVIDDVASLALVAVMVPIVTGDGSMSSGDIVLLLLKAAAFFGVIVFLGAWLFPSNAAFADRLPWLRAFHLQRLISLHDGEHATLAVLLLALLVAILGHEFGFHPAVGAYMAGLLLKEEYFYLLNDPEHAVFEDTRRIIDNVAFSWIGPVFFVSLGTHLLLELDILMQVVGYALLLFVALLIGQTLSAGLAARFTGGFSSAESCLIGFGMLGRAELAFIVMDIAFVQYQIISRELFYTLMITAFCLNVAVPISIRLWKNVTQN